MSTRPEAIVLPGGASAPFSAAYRVGDVIFTSGTVGIDPATGTVPAEFADEMRQTLTNLKRTLEAAGSNMSAVIKTTCLLTDLSDLAEFNRIYTEMFAEPRPARSTFQVGLVQNFRVEIEAVAVAV